MERRKQEHGELQVSEGSGTMVSFRGMQEPGSRYVLKEGGKVLMEHRRGHQWSRYRTKGFPNKRTVD